MRKDRKRALIVFILLNSINNLDLHHEKRQKEGTYSLSNIGSFLAVGF